MFERGKFTAPSTALVSAVFLGLGPSLVGWSLLELTARPLFALDQPWLPTVAAAIPVVVNVVVTLRTRSPEPQWIGVGGVGGVDGGISVRVGDGEAAEEGSAGGGRLSPAVENRGSPAVFDVGFVENKATCGSQTADVPRFCSLRLTCRAEKCAADTRSSQSRSDFQIALSVAGHAYFEISR